MSNPSRRLCFELPFTVAILTVFSVPPSAAATGSDRHLQCWEPTPPATVQLRNFDARTELPPHPRLRLNDSRLAALKRTIREDATAKAYFEGLIFFGEALLTQPHVDCTAAHMSNTQSRTTLTIQYNLGLLWRLTGDKRFAARAAQELLHVTTNCTTWDPYGLVLAEMTHAVGLGYDWLYHYLTPVQRHAIIAGVTRMGFGEALTQYTAHVFWSNCTFNWGVVTNGGLTIGGLAFLDEPLAAANASAVLAKAAIGIRCPFGSFAPHGGWHEGSMYWQYVAEYAVATTEALRGVYGHDHGLSGAPGFNETALFRLYMNGPSQASFDFGDSNGALSNSAAGYFMGYSALPSSNSQMRSLCAYEARRLAKLIAGYVDTADQTAQTKYDCGGRSPLRRAAYFTGERIDATTAVDCARLLIDFSPTGSDAEIQALPTARLFKLSAFGWDYRDAIGFFRSAWSVESEGASGKHSYLAFKAANGVPNHNDLDGGTFVFEAGGQRWAMDMGSDSYNLKNYFTQSLEYRYGYYRKSTAGHNTLTFNNDGANFAACAQDPGMSGRTEISLFRSHDTGSDINISLSPSSPAYSIVELTAAYGRQGSKRVQRGFAFTASYEHLVVVDEFEFASKAQIQNVTWAMHTMADIKLLTGSSGGNGLAVLTLGAASLHARVIEPKGAAFSTAGVDLQPPQLPSTGVNKLMVVLPMQESPDLAVKRIVVELSTSAIASSLVPTALALWNESGPFVAGDDEGVRLKPT